MNTFLIFLFVIPHIISCNSQNDTNQEKSVKNSINVELIQIGGETYKKTTVKGLERVFDIARDESGNLLILQFEPPSILLFNDNIFKSWIGIDSTGEFTPQWASAQSYNDRQESNNPHAPLHSFVTGNQSSNNIFVVYFGKENSKQANVIAKYDIATGSFLGSFGITDNDNFSNGFTFDVKQSQGIKKFKGIVNGVFDKYKNLYVADYAACIILKFDENLKLLNTIGGKSKDKINYQCSNSPGSLDRPHGIAVDSKNNLFVADTWNNRIQRFNSSGEFTGWLGENESGFLNSNWDKIGLSKRSTKRGGFDGPITIKIDYEDNLFILDWRSGRLQKFRNSGESIWVIEGFKEGYGLQIYSNEIIVADTGNNQVIIFKKEL